MSWIIVNERGQQVGKTSAVPILSLENGERISYRSDLYFGINDFGCPANEKKTMNVYRKDCKAIIEIENCSKGKYSYIFTVVGTDPVIVCEMVEELSRKFFNVTDIDWKDIIRGPFLPALKSFKERFNYIFRWLFTGKTEKVRRLKIKRIGLRPKYQEKFQLKTNTYLKKLPKREKSDN